MPDTLPGLERGVTLTVRQALALAVIQQHAPIGCEELGRRVREARGTRGDEYDRSNGRALATALKRARGGPLIRELRGQVFVPVGWTEPLADGAYDPARAEVPF